MSKFVLPDTCFWYALFDRRDRYHEKSVEKYDDFKDEKIIFPWPISYEVLRTRFVKNPGNLEKLKKELARPNIEIVDDSKYRDNSLNSVLDGMARNSRNEALSLVDEVLNSIISDVNVKVDYVVTSNVKDFQESCSRRKVPIIDIS